MFGCVIIGDGKYEKNLLYSDFRIDCDSSYHNLWIKQAACPILIFFLFLYPLYIVGKMYKTFQRKQSENHKEFNFKFGYFFFAYKERFFFFFWDFVILLRKLILLFINSYFFSRVTDTIDYYPIMVLISVLSLAFLLQIYCQPFKIKDFHIINGLEELSLIVSFFSIVLALIYMTMSDIKAFGLLFLFLVSGGLNTGFFCLWFWRYYQHYAKDKIKGFCSKLYRNFYF